MTEAARAAMPAIGLVAVPGRWNATLELAREIERRGFAGIYSPSLGDAMGLCLTLAVTTERIRFGTSIVNIYTRHPADYAQTAAAIHELSAGRFAFGIGVSHGPMNERMGLATGKPLADVRGFVEGVRAASNPKDHAPVVLATLRDPMIRLADEIGDGIVFANAARSRTPQSLSVLSAARRDDADFFIGNMIPVCIADDARAAAERNRKTMLFYLGLSNYREYWKAAGYVDEMNAVEAALTRGDRKAIGNLVGDRWLADCTLFGPASKVREGLDAWREAGIRTPILVPSSASGNQFRAFEELFAAFS